MGSDPGLELRTSGCCRAASSAEKTRDAKPRKRQDDQKVREILTVDAVRTVRFRRVVQWLAVRKNVGFGEFVEPVDEKLNDEHQQEDRSDLEEARQVDPVAI